MTGVMSGYGVKIRQLRDEDLAEHPGLRDKVALDEECKYPIDWCIAIDGEDMASGLAAVVYVAPGAEELVWHDESELLVGGLRLSLTDIPDRKGFVDAVCRVVHAVHPELVIA